MARTGTLLGFDDLDQSDDLIQRDVGWDIPSGEILFELRPFGEQFFFEIVIGHAQVDLAVG
jgi:hypothetical protein